MFKSEIKSHYSLLIGLMFTITMTASVAMAEVKTGKSLHNENCLKCHDASVYTRENRQINSYAVLTARVKRCYKVAGAKWSDTEFKAVVDYLNTSFYKFKAEKK